MVNSYTFNEKNDYSKKGIAVVVDYLKSLGRTVKVNNVEDNKEFQQKDVDLIWIYKSGLEEIISHVEVKTDRYKTGNFWLETTSNEELQTTGCFLKSKADLFFYYFSEWDRLYIIPMKQAQSWLMTNINRFRESKTTTKDENEKYQHTTVGRIVPIDIMRREVKDIKVIDNVSKINNS